MKFNNVPKRMISFLVSVFMAMEFISPTICSANSSLDELKDALLANAINLVEAEKEAIEDSIDKKTPFLVGKLCNYSILDEDSVSLTQATEEEKAEMEELIKEKTKENKVWKMNWYLSRNYDNIPFNEFHVRTQKDIRNNNDEIQESELFMKLQ